MSFQATGWILSSHVRHYSSHSQSVSMVQSHEKLRSKLRYTAIELLGRSFSTCRNVSLLMMFEYKSSGS